jgi:cytochrome P450
LVNLRTLCFDLFVAGQETTATTLNFLVLYLLLDQEAQRKMHNELDQLDNEKEQERESGDHNNDDDDENYNSAIGVADRPKLPYLNAVINVC